MNQVMKMALESIGGRPRKSGMAYKLPAKPLGLNANYEYQLLLSWGGADMVLKYAPILPEGAKRKRSDWTKKTLFLTSGMSDVLTWFNDSVEAFEKEKKDF